MSVTGRKIAMSIQRAGRRPKTCFHIRDSLKENKQEVGNNSVSVKPQAQPNWSFLYCFFLTKYWSFFKYRKPFPSSQCWLRIVRGGGEVVMNKDELTGREKSLRTSRQDLNRASLSSSLQGRQAKVWPRGLRTVSHHPNPAQGVPISGQQCVLGKNHL